MREALALLASGDTLERSRALDEAWVVGTTIASCTMGVHAHPPPPWRVRSVRGEGHGVST